MRHQHFCLILATLFILLNTAACSSTRAVETAPQPPPASSETDTASLEEIYWARQDSAKMRFTKADVDFMTGMIGHHAQALIMSRMAPTHGASPVVQTLASRIDNAQQDEIQSMQKWLRDRDQPVPEVHIDGTKLMIHGAGDHAMHHNMPGMLSPEQMQELDDARGAEFDRLFLTYMIQHHSGAVSMVSDLFGTDGAGQDEAAFKLASDINVDQITEIARMKLVLSELTDSTDTP